MKREWREGDFCLDTRTGKVKDQDIGASPATATDVTDFYSKILNVQNIDWLSVWLQATSADGGSTGLVTFKFLTAAESDILFEDSTNTWDETLTLAGDKSIKKFVRLNVRGVKFIKLYQIANGDAAVITDANAWYYGEEQN